MRSKNSILPVAAILIAFSLGCSMLRGSGIGEAAVFNDPAGKFTVVFPGGPGGVETEKSNAKFALGGSTYAKSFDNRSDNYRSYEVQALDMGSSVTGKDRRDILKVGLNGWDDEPGTVVKDVNINGQQAIDSVRTVEIGPAKMTFREVVFWSEKDKKMYILQIAATNKSNVSAKEANDFVESFKLNG
jgi:hypothetical protein